MILPKNYMSINLMIWLQSRIQRLFLTLVNISIDGKTIHRDIDEVIKPYSEINIDARNPKWIEFSTVNDKGGTTPPIKINL